MSARDETALASLGSRMKGYELATRQILPRRTYTIVRVDGRAFHTYLADARKPYDEDFMISMEHTAVALCQEMTGAVFAYGQSDEISILLCDFATIASQSWLGGNVQKLASVSASIASVNFYAQERLSGLRAKTLLPTFDSRVYTVPDPVEVANYFVWRQQDAVRNSVSMAAHFNFTNEELEGKNWGERQEMLYQRCGINWNDYRDDIKRGWIVARRNDLEETWASTGRPLSESNPWQFTAAPSFVAEPGSFLSRVIPNRPSLNR